MTAIHSGEDVNPRKIISICLRNARRHKPIIGALFHCQTYIEDSILVPKGVHDLHKSHSYTPNIAH